MKLLMLIFLALAVACQCAVVPLDVNLIEQTCKKTPFYDLCVSSIKSDPRSSEADVTGLALIMVGVVKKKTTETLSHIEKCLSVAPAQRRPLSSCVETYTAVLDGDIPEAIEALTDGDPKFAEQAANDAANEADSCEAKFTGGSPMTALNKDVHDVAAVTAAIVRLLL